MPVLPILLVVEILSALLVSSATQNTISSVKNSFRHLPLVFAQEDPAVDSIQPLDSSLDTSSSPSDAEVSSQTANPDQSSNTTTDSNQSLLNEANSQAEVQTFQPDQPLDQKNQPNDQFSQAGSLNPDSSQSFSVTAGDSLVSQASSTVLTSNNLVEGPAENIDQKVEDNAKKEDEQLRQATTPQEIAILSIDFAKNSIKQIETHLRSDDFSTTSFVAQRLSDQIDNARNQAQKKEGGAFSQRLKTFCLQADILLRSQQLVVPENNEQDFEIIRGKCLDITK